MNLITIPAPHVPNGPVGIPEHKADADYIRSAIRNLEHQINLGRKFAGSNLTATVFKLLADVAEQLDNMGEPPAFPATPDVLIADARRQFGPSWPTGSKDFDSADWLAWQLAHTVGQLTAELDEYAELTDRQSRILTDVVNAVRGRPEPLTHHSHHDAAELVQALVAENAALRAQLAETEEVAGA